MSNEIIDLEFKSEALPNQTWDGQVKIIGNDKNQIAIVVDSGNHTAAQNIRDFNYMLIKSLKQRGISLSKKSRIFIFYPASISITREDRYDEKLEDSEVFQISKESIIKLANCSSEDLKF